MHDAAAGRRRSRLVRAVNELANLLTATRQIVAKGRPGRPAEFGHKAQIVDNDDGIVTADHGYGEANVDNELTDQGVKNVVIPRKGKPSQARRAEEHRPPSGRTITWRTGCEGRISTLKRGYGWDRTRIDGTGGARIWTGHGVLTHNLVKISTLTA